MARQTPDPAAGASRWEAPAAGSSRPAKDLAMITGTELLNIGPGTSTHDFQRELRWNAVYYHLADGL